MDVDTESVVKLVFPEGIPEQWKDNPDFAEYLSHLGSLGVENLNHELDRLSEEKAAVLEQTQDLAFRNYKTFIQTAECSRAIFKEFNSAEQHLDSLIDHLPEFSNRCQDFSRASADISSRRQRNSLTLARHTRLLELLELPQLMDSCVRSGAHQETLELAAYVQRLEKRHGNIPIIESIVQDVQVSWQLMLEHLLAQLRTDISLPRCLQAVGFLRRMEIFSEPELRLKFLQARDAWLQSLLNAVPKQDACQHLTQTVELSRVHLFTIVTQYRAIFSDEEPIYLPTRSQGVLEGAIFYSWIVEKISQFIKTVEKDLPRCPGSSLGTLLEQCMYFGLSFSRVGADFRGLLTRPFVKAAITNLETGIARATKKFELYMDSYTPAKTQPPKIPSSQTTPVTDANKEELHPPMALLDFYPLAELCNDILTCLNELRLCAPACIAGRAAATLQGCLDSSSQALARVHRREQQTLSPAEKLSLESFASALSNDLAPFLQRCFAAVFPPQTVSKLLGTMPHSLPPQIAGYINVEAVHTILSSVLPEQPPVSLLSSVSEQESVPELQASEGDCVLPAAKTEEVPVSAFGISEAGSEEPVLERADNSTSELMSESILQTISTQ